MHFFLNFITWSRQPGNLNESFYILEKVSLFHPLANKYTHTYMLATPVTKCLNIQDVRYDSKFKWDTSILLLNRLSTHEVITKV